MFRACMNNDTRQKTMGHSHILTYPFPYQLVISYHRLLVKEALGNIPYCGCISCGARLLPVQNRFWINHSKRELVQQCHHGSQRPVLVTETSHKTSIGSRADSRFAPSQWETVLLCNDLSDWLGASLESALGSGACIGKYNHTTLWDIPSSL